MAYRTTRLLHEAVETLRKFLAEQLHIRSVFVRPVRHFEPAAEVDVFHRETPRDGEHPLGSFEKHIHVVNVRTGVQVHAHDGEALPLGQLLDLIYPLERDAEFGLPPPDRNLGMSTGKDFPE